MFVRTLSAEVLKYRRTSALWLALGLPLAVELLLLLIFFVVPDVRKLSLAGRWNFFTHSPLTTWIQTFLPLGLGIIAALALGLEHQDNQWKHVLVLGPTRVMVYLAKVLAVTALILSASVVLALSGLVVGGLFTGFHGIPWAEVGRGAGLAFLGSLGMISLQTWLATRFRAIGLSIGAASVPGNSGRHAQPLRVLGLRALVVPRQRNVVSRHPVLAAGGALARRRRPGDGPGRLGLQPPRHGVARIA